VVKIGKEEVPADCYDLSYESNINAGKATMTVTADPTRCNYEFGGSVSTKFDITAVKFSPSKTETRVTATLFAGTYVYTGNAICPEETVYDEVLGVALVKDVDYTVTYKNNVNVGDKASVTIKGKGNYSGSITLTFNIVEKNMSVSGNDFEVFVKNSAYTGKTVTPRITVLDNGTILKVNKDYKLSIEQAVESEGFNGSVVNKGKYIITIEGMGSYTGQLEEDYYLYVY